MTCAKQLNMRDTPHDASPMMHVTCANLVYVVYSLPRMWGRVQREHAVDVMRGWAMLEVYAVQNMM